MNIKKIPTSEQHLSLAHTIIVVISLLTLMLPPVAAQGTKADYQRADELRKRTSNKVFRTKVSPHWFDDNQKFWYRNDLADGQREWKLVDVPGAKCELAFDHQKLANALKQEAQKEVDAQRLPFKNINVLGDEIQFTVFNQHWSFHRQTNELHQIEKEDRTSKENSSQNSSSKKQTEKQTKKQHSKHRTSRSSVSPNKEWKIEIQNHNVQLVNQESKESHQLTTDGTPEDHYLNECYWSPNSEKVVVIKHRKEQQHEVHIVESSPKDQLQPKLHTIQYLKPGDQIAWNKPHLFDINDKREIEVSDELFSNPWSINKFRWSADSSRFRFVYNQRGHQTLNVLSVDGNSGEVKTLIDETSKTFVDYSYKHYQHDVDGTDEMIWMSERDGWNHLYLFDANGKLLNQITSGEWVVRKVERVDDERREIWFQASGIYPDQDPYYIHSCRVNFDGTNFTKLTSGDGTHEIKYSPDENTFLDTYSRVDMPPVTELRKTEDGSLICELERADWSELLATSWQTPQRFSAKGRDDQTEIYGVIFRPTNFDPEKKYPVIEQIYAGPHGSFVPKKFNSFHSAQEMAELGFIVVQIDGMGTSNRSKAFHDVCWKNLGDSGFPDRILWMKAAAKKYPSLDLTRVGIYGGSAGGQSSTRALLAFGDFYHVAVSDCGCHDNRMDKIWWNELWMSWPIGPHYKEQSNVTQAHRLTGKLLLIVGELDRNVDPASTMQVVNALIKADKDFEMLVIPGSGHGIGGSYGIRKRRDFFVKHLLKVTPRE